MLPRPLSRELRKMGLSLTATVNLYYYIVRIKWPISKHGQLEFGSEFEHNGSNECEIVNEGSSKPIRDNQVIRVAWNSLFFEFNIEGNYKLCR